MARLPTQPARSVSESEVEEIRFKERIDRMEADALDEIDSMVKKAKAPYQPYADMTHNSQNIALAQLTAMQQQPRSPLSQQQALWQAQQCNNQCQRQQQASNFDALATFGALGGLFGR